MDPNGGAVPGAKVVLQGPTPHDSYTGLASDNGFFELRNVKPGVPFRVTILPSCDAVIHWLKNGLNLF